MAFPGAWDYGYLKMLLEELNAYALVPKQELLENGTGDIRVGQAGEHLLLVYVPSNTKVRLASDLSGWDIRALGLAERFAAYVDVEIKEGKTVIGMHPFEEDALIVARKR